MNPVILTSAYWPNVQYFTKLYAAPYVVMEHNDHYVKQTYRNRCIIEGPDGPLTLTVPVEHGGVVKPTTGEVRVSEHGNWRHLHWNALVSAYEKSPYFFYYADEFRPFYEQRFDRLVELNGAIVAKVCELLDLRPKSFSRKTTTRPPTANRTCGNSYGPKPISASIPTLRPANIIRCFDRSSVSCQI